MKLNLLMRSNDLLAGYVNVDPLDMTPPKTFCQLDNLDKVVVDGEADEIRAVNIIQYYGLQAAVKTMSHWVRKLSHKGKLTIVAPQTTRLTRRYNEDLNTQEFNQLLFGPQTQPWQTYKSAWTLQDVRKLFEQFGLVTLEMSIEDNHFLIIGERP